MRTFKITLATLAAWTAVAALIWPHTSYSGADAEAIFAEIEHESRTQSPLLAAGCQAELYSYGRERMRGALARDYPSSERFYRSAEAPANRYLDAGCAAGPFLGVTAAVNERAASQIGSLPLSSTRMNRSLR